MVGNDVDEDLVISKLGVKTYLITNIMENKKNLPITADYTGTLEDFYSFIGRAGSSLLNQSLLYLWLAGASLLLRSTGYRLHRLE